MNLLHRLFVLVFEPRPRAQPTRLAPTLAETRFGDGEVIDRITVRLADLRRARPSCPVER